MNDPANNASSASGLNGNGDPDHCRICRSEGSSEQPLFHPCKCSGSIKFVHQDCLQEWLQHSQKKHCELCKTPFHFTNLYHPDMPTTLPTPLFLNRLLRHLFRNLVLWARALLVGCVWLGGLPYCVGWMWRMLFWLSDGGGWWSEQACNRTGTASATAAPLANLPATPTVSSALMNSTSSAFGRAFIDLLLLSGPIMSPVNGGRVAANVTSTNNSTLSNGTISIRVRLGGLFIDPSPFYKFTRYPAVDGVTADIFEDQLLTALIAISFILIVLIRRWVVHHQPIRIVLIRPALGGVEDDGENEVGDRPAIEFPPNALRAIADEGPAHDFDGIMELIGMRGPLAGLLQNVAFSIVLITATVALGVAFPYVMGKIVLIILANPMLLLTVPTTVLNIAVDFATEFIACLLPSLLFVVMRFLFRLIERAVPVFSGVSSSLLLHDILTSRCTRKMTYLKMYPEMMTFPWTAAPPVSALIRQTYSLSFPQDIGVDASTPVAFFIYCFTKAIAALFRTRKSGRNAATQDISPENLSPLDPVYIWSVWDRVAAVFIGYSLLTIIGMLYHRGAMKRDLAVNGRVVERITVELLAQAGGVMKVVLIVGIEMLAFPLYCGLLLDFALLPLFEEATILSRIQCFADFPLTSVFVHWFVGKCNMFHLDLFVSMCRKIMRSGVLHFIRDPDDPNFPPRDVLDRPVTTQLRKIGFSALIYAVLVIVCLGGVVWSLHLATESVLPIHWSSNEPVLEFPVDLLLIYNLFMPIVVQFVKPSDAIQKMYGWWFRRCARFLRLTSFMFGDRIVDEEGHHDERDDPVDSPNGPNSPDFKLAYLPPWLKTRIGLLFFAIWGFAAFTGVGVTIGPLLLGRSVLKQLVPPNIKLNDIYAFSFGIYIIGAFAYAGAKWKLATTLVRRGIRNARESDTLWRAMGKWLARIAKITYVLTAFAIVLPTLLALMIEFYFIIPIHTYFSNDKQLVIQLIQDWTLVVLCIMMMGRMLVVNRDSIWARSLWGVVARGYLDPDVKLATKHFIVPAGGFMLVALLLPPALGFIAANTFLKDPPAERISQIYRYSYPAVFAALPPTVLGCWWRSHLSSWKQSIVDETYLMGKQLQNHGEDLPTTSEEPASDSASIAVANP